jgi:hypothetical protein
MKTIKSLKQTKEVELGEIRRVDDKTAHNMVGSMWGYISKKEWKSSTPKPTPVDVSEKSKKNLKKTSK